MSSSLTSGPPGPSLAASCDKAAGAEPPKLVQRKTGAAPVPICDDQKFRLPIVTAKRD